MAHSAALSAPSRAVTLPPPGTGAGEASSDVKRSQLFPLSNSSILYTSFSY